MSANGNGALSARMGMEKAKIHIRAEHAPTANGRPSVEVEKAMKFDYDWAG